MYSPTRELKTRVPGSASELILCNTVSWHTATHQRLGPKDPGRRHPGRSRVHARQERTDKTPATSSWNSLRPLKQKRRGEVEEEGKKASLKRRPEVRNASINKLPSSCRRSDKSALSESLPGHARAAPHICWQTAVNNEARAIVINHGLHSPPANALSVVPGGILTTCR